MGKVGGCRWGVLGWVLATGCGGPGTSTNHAEERLESSSLHASQVIEHLQGAFQIQPAIQPAHAPRASEQKPRPLLASGGARGFLRKGASLRPTFDPPGRSGSTPGTTVAEVVLPAASTDSFQLRDVPSGLSISVTLRGATGGTVEVANGYVVYPAAYEQSADVLQRPYSSGTEESIVFATQPSAERVTYDVALSRGIAGVRLVANTVEFLDGHGAPRLRMAPPFVAGSQSTSAWPMVSVASCAVDVSPAPPWNRRVVRPGTRHCAVTVDWSQSGIQYPAVLDPTWSVGSTMAVARWHHAGAVVTANGRELALVFGGYAYTSTLASAELFDETTGTWASTGSLVADVSYVPVVTPNSGTALALGGFRVSAAGGSEYDGVQAYNAAAGQWTLQGHLGSAREEHTATLLGNGSVLVAGGFGPYPTVFASALLYNPSTGTASPAGSMQSARGDHTATLLASGKVLVVDGINTSAVPQGAADLYDPVANSWSAVAAPPPPARFSHVASLLGSGKVLIAGGEELPAGIAQTLGTAIYDPTAGTWSAGPPTTGSHYLGSATVLTQGANVGKVVVAGGDFALNGVELFDPGTSTWKSISPVLTGRDAHVALALQSGILFAGGSDSNGTLLSSAELYKPDVAATAPQWPAQTTLTVTALTPTSVTLTWSAATDPNGVASYACYENGVLVATVSGSSLSCTISGLSPGAAATFVVQAVDPSGAPTGNGPGTIVCPPVDICHQAGTFSTATNACTVAPPLNIDDGNPCTLDTCDPVNGIVHHACSPVDRTVSTPTPSAAAFLFTGTSPVQTGVDAGVIAPATMAVLRGMVRDATGAALPGVSVTVAGHPELGSTMTQGSGAFDIAVNGGQPVRLHFALAGYLPVERLVQSPWQDYAKADDVTMSKVDLQATVVDLSNTTDIQVARGSMQTDDAGARQATVMVPPSTQAMMVMPDGGTTTLGTMTVRATEYTVGANGPSAMPGALPPTSAYTYAFELSADEAMAAGATSVTFSQPLPLYVEDFLGFPGGTTVPVGYYDKTKGAWVPSASGVVIQILSETGAVAQIDVNGDAVADTGAALTALGITTLELQQLATTYAVGQLLWRVQVPHFSSYDLNWGFASPDGAGPPSAANPAPPPPGPGDCQQQGSIIGCQRQSLGQDLPIAGTQYSLHYESDNQVAQTSLQIAVSGLTLAGPVKRIDMEIDIAGRVFTQSFPAAPNQLTSFTWDGTDAYGRLLQGAQPVTVRVGNTYDGAYEQPDMFADDSNGIRLTGSTTRREVTIWKVWNGVLGEWDEKPLGLGGWSLDVHHTYDPVSHALHFGDGSELTPASLPGVIQTFAGMAPCNIPAPYGDNDPATSACLSSPTSVAVGPDGSVYVTNGTWGVRRVGLDGIIHTVAGTVDASGFSGDEGPATSALLHRPYDLAFGPDGSMYIADASNNRIRKVDPTGIIHTVAGSGSTASGGFSGDGFAATQATLNFPTGVDVTADGTIYIADENNQRIRRVGPDGIIQTVAGNGPGGCSDTYGNLATAHNLCNGARVRVASDGGFYIVETNWNVVERVGTDGIIQIFAGILSSGPQPSSGDGGPATAAMLGGAADVATAPDGSVFILTGDTVRRVDGSGIISTVAGQPNRNGFGGDNGPATAAIIAGQQGGIRLSPDGSLYIADWLNQRVRRVQQTLPGFSFETSVFQFASSDGGQVFTFDGSGRHLQTTDAFTGATLYQFSYDTAGRLSAVTDVNSNVTQINRDANGNPTSIVPPFAQATTLTVDSNGYLASVEYPASETTHFTYSPQGLMATMTDARGGLHQFSYDTAGRLQEDQDPAGGSKTLNRTELTGGFSVAITTALGRQSTYQTTLSSIGTFSRQNTLPDGTQSSLQFATTGTTTTTTPDGTTTTTTEGPDPRFGMLSPLFSTTTQTPSGLTSVESTTRSFTTSGGNLATWTEQTTVNGHTWTRLFTASSRTWTATSPVGRQTSTVVDSAGRPTQITVPNIAATSLTYDAQGRLKTMAQGTSTWTMGYDPTGFLSSVTDPLSHAVSYQNDAIGRPTQTTLPDGRIITTGYDADGNVTSVTLPSPSQNLHDLSYTPVNLLSSYTPPSLDMSSWATQYSYNLDRQITTVTRPDTLAITSGYDTFGRLSGVTYPQGTLSRTYDTSGRLATLASPIGETLTYAYDGFLRSGLTWSGAVAGSLAFGRDNNFLITSQTLNAGTALLFGYDNDQLLTQAGALTVARDPQNGRVTGTTLNSVTDTYSYDANGFLSAYVAKYSGSVVYSETVNTRDAVNRITQKTDVIGTETHVWAYTYDADGRLTDVTKDSVAVGHYGYDADDNRTTFTGTGGTVHPTYDAQDRLTTYGSATYAYTRNGELTTKTVGAQVTGYTYDVLGNLLHVGLPSGTALDYVVDGENRRVGKKVGGTLSQGFLYQDALNVVAQLDGSGNVVARFVFGSKPNVPDYFTSSAGTFRILSAHLGSPRLIVNTSTGVVAERIDYDEFGNVTTDTSPGLTPFGFAGGLYDKDSGLERFGARDYDASVGRWTSKDPVRFAGGTNLYGYAVNDPVNLVDPSGRFAPAGGIIIVTVVAGGTAAVSPLVAAGAIAAAPLVAGGIIAYDLWNYFHPTIVGPTPAPSPPSICPTKESGDPDEDCILTGGEPGGWPNGAPSCVYTCNDGLTFTVEGQWPSDKPCSGTRRRGDAP